jgi:hypothetical protein
MIGISITLTFWGILGKKKKTRPKSRYII